MAKVQATGVLDQPIGQAQAIAPSKAGIDELRASRPVIRAEDTRSGDLTRELLTAAPGGQVAAASAAVSGAPFHGRIANLQGARVTASPVIRSGLERIAPTGNQHAFIVDFGRSVSVLGLQLAKTGTIALVVPWMGTDFARDAVYVRPTNLIGGHDVGLSGLETTKLLVQLTGGPTSESAFAGECVITTGTLPANVRASLNGRLPFWTQAGPLDREVALTGLGEDLEALLADAQQTTVVTLTLASDAPGVLSLDFDPAATQIDSSVPARWAGQPSTAVALAALAPQAVAVPLAADAGTAATWQIRRLVAEATGDFPPWRAYPAQEGAAPGNLGLRIDAAFSVARRLLPAQDIELHGVALLLRAPAAAAALHVELMPGADAPPAGAKPLAAAELTLEPGATADVAAGWHEVHFDAPVTVPAAGGAWLVVQARTGAAEWVAGAEAAAASTTTLGAAEGGRWDRYPPVGAGAPVAVAVAQTRILRTPLATENDALLTVAWSDLAGAAATADPGRDPVTIALERPGDQPLLVSTATGPVLELTITARAGGTLDIRGATILYREQP